MNQKSLLIFVGHMSNDLANQVTITLQYSDSSITRSLKNISAKLIYIDRTKIGISLAFRETI